MSVQRKWKEKALINCKEITQNKILENIKWKMNKLKTEDYHKRSGPTHTTHWSWVNRHFALYSHSGTQADGATT